MIPEVTSSAGILLRATAINDCSTFGLKLASKQPLCRVSVVRVVREVGDGYVAAGSFFKTIL